MHLKFLRKCLETWKIPCSVLNQRYHNGFLDNSLMNVKGKKNKLKGGIEVVSTFSHGVPRQPSQT